MEGMNACPVTMAAVAVRVGEWSDRSFLDANVSQTTKEGEQAKAMRE